MQKKHLYHRPVLLTESVDGLDVQPDGVYVDITFGGGGHAREILSRLGKRGVVIAFDQDLDAQVNVANIKDERLKFVRGNFRFLTSYLLANGVREIDGLLGDLGVSSHQFDTPERGFSFRFDADLDMRMSNKTRMTAAAIVNEYTQEQLMRVFSEYGEIENAHRLVKCIINVRQSNRILTTGQFLKAVEFVVPKFEESSYLAKVFQSLRIEVNREMCALEQLLMQLAGVIKKDGRFVFITYHSLEDRLVKNYIKYGKIRGESDRDIYGNASVPFKGENKKVIFPGREEIASNSRARSAKLRIALRQ
ncbi:MAG: 16S rRNA (cytosine(1402)-N(4))-methyltransferase RsmH [Bacteroidales bacterium]